MSESQGLLLIVDDDASHRTMLEAVVRDRVSTIMTAASAEEALAILDRCKPDLVLLDMRMPGMGGMGFLHEIRRLGLTLPVVVVTAFAEVEAAVEAMKLGAVDYLSKPIELSMLEAILDRFVGKREGKSRGSGLPELPEGVVVESPLMGQVVAEVAAAAPSRASVLMVGESGTGKEVLADLLHRWSDRADKPQVRINVSAIPAALIESELFGHEKGAFTGAGARRIGHFEQADGGTLFLDEIGELPLEMQPKLLRALETGHFRRLGGSAEIEVDLRVVSATNKDLAEEVERGTFRKDLFYRLAVFVVEIPPLRERTEEILPLATTFFERCGGAKFLGQAARNCLLSYSWPGNIRELRNSIQRAAILAPGDRVMPEHLPPALRQGCTGERPDQDEPQRLAEIEKQAILEALERCGGNRTRAAKELGVSRRKLLYRLKDYGV